MRLRGQSPFSCSLLSSSREISLIAWPDLPSGYRTARSPVRIADVTSSALYLRIDVKKGRETRFELLLDLIFSALEGVHGDVRLTPIFQFDGRLADRVDFIGRQQTQTVNQCQVCHPTIVSQGMLARRYKPEKRSHFAGEAAGVPGRSHQAGPARRP